MTKVAFLGLGAMGGRMAAHLLKAGHSVTVWNRDADKALALTARGAAIGGIPRAAVRGPELVISMLRDDPASSSVWLDAETGALGGMSADSLAVECSTLARAEPLLKTMGRAVHHARRCCRTTLSGRPGGEGSGLLQ